MSFTYLAWGIGCFAKGTPVLTPDGYKPINKLSVGDMVTTFDGEQVHACPIEFVSGACNQPKPMIQFTYEDKTVRATYDHPFYDGEKYYPLYQFIWGNLEDSQRLQLKLLCEQYGQVIDDTPSRGLSYSDTQTWERPIWASTNSDERQDHKSPSGSGSDLVAEPRQSIDDKPYRLQPSEQSDKKLRVVYPETEQPTCVPTGTTEQVAGSGSESKKKELYNGAMSPDMGLVVDKNIRCGEKQSAYPNKVIHRITETISRNTDGHVVQYNTLPIRLHSIQILPAEPYYAIGVKDIHTYIVHDLPVHNTGKTKEALDRATTAGNKQIIVFAPSVLKTMNHWPNEADKWGCTIPMEVHTYHKLQLYGRDPSTTDHKLPDGGRGVAIIIDESHKVKNSQSQQGLGAFKLVKDNPNADIYLLSGSPAPNGYVDFCNYAKMTGLIRNKTDFYSRYVRVTTWRGFPEVVGYNNTDELNEWWRRTADIKPPIIFTKEHDIWVNFPVVNAELYAKRTRVGILEKGEHYLLENASQLTHFCRLAACSTKVRRDWLENFLDSTEDNVVVFTSYTRASQDVLDIAKKLKKTVYRVDGDVKDLPDEMTAKRLKNAVIVVNYQAGGVGLNLQYANHAVFYTPTYSYSDYMQARGRISRRGQIKRCTFYHLQADKSIEKDVYKCLAKKEDFNSKLWNSQFEKVDGKNNDILVM